MNRLFLLFLFFTTFQISGSAQISVQATYQSILSKGDEPVLADNLVTYSVHFWTRLKRYRIEFLPGLLYQAEPSFKNEIRNMGVTLPIAVYPLDFVNDCDCPTFSKRSFWFQKGLFFRLTSSWTINIGKQQGEAVDQLAALGISTGLDFGLSDFITMTPLIGYSRMQSVSGTEFQGNYLNFGVSALFRFDYRR